MNRFGIASVVVIGGLIMAGTWTRSLSGQQTRVCLHGTDETAAERTRRNEAVGYVRSVHNAQARFYPSSSRYGQIAELSDVRPLPTGFTLQHAADTQGYMFSVKDMTDQCRFTLYSDHAGLIYEAVPMR